MTIAARDICLYRNLLYRAKHEEHLTTTVAPDGMSYEYDALRLLCLSEMVPYELACAEVRPSRVHGRGVFATRAIAPGDFITFYPGDVAGYAPNGDRAVADHVSVRVPSDRMCKKYGADSGQMFDNDYALDYDEHYSIVGHPDFCDDPNYLGHMINDGAKPTADPASYRVYRTITQAKSNSGFERLHGIAVAVVATHNIEPGEEILTSYGLPYWIKRAK